MERIEPFCDRVHIDLMDGIFAPTTSPGLDQVWWPSTMKADLHLMYQNPMEKIDQLISLHPSLVIIHQEAVANHHEFADRMHQEGIKVGLAILKSTPVEEISDSVFFFDHILIFSGDLGRHGGIADTNILNKGLKVFEYNPDIEIGWDGGVNDQNAEEIIDNCFTVLNVGSFVQDSDDPAAAYAKLKTIK
jgi:ribulose-phosphate 3-epimerase